MTTRVTTSNLLQISETSRVQLSSSSDDGDQHISANTNSDEEEKTPTPVDDILKRQSDTFTSEPAQQRRLDPLIASLTKMDEDMLNTPTTKVPLLGEIPLDGSIVVLAPAAVIAVVGFIMSINIGLNNKDALFEKVTEVNTVLSKPPVKKSVVLDTNSCRGLCSNQDEQLESMRGFMQGLAQKNKSVQETSVPAVEATISEIVTVENEPNGEAPAEAVVTDVLPTE